MTQLSPLGVTMLAGYREYDSLQRRAMALADAGAGDEAWYRVAEQAEYFGEIKHDYAEGLKMLAARGPVLAPDGSIVEIAGGDLVVHPPAFIPAPVDEPRDERRRA